MFIGFDYGSANCAVGIMQGDNIQLLPLSQHSPYLPSVVYAYDKDLIAEAVYHGLPTALKTDYAKLRAGQLGRARMARHALDLDAETQAVFVGEAAVNAYLCTPEEGFYVRSPKSFLGATGLRPEQIALFEDIVTLMMQYIKQHAETELNAEGETRAIKQAVIGRPVNFQGIGGENSNQQAEKILTLAAKRAGFSEVMFLFEPLAAGMDFEATLSKNQTVLVVDVGGGTTDCSVVKMGPSHINQQNRTADCLGHSGQRVGGNDLDIALAMQAIMPHFGLRAFMKNGKPMPSKLFRNAVTVNDMGAQREFNSLACHKLILALVQEAQQPKLLTRLLMLQQQKLGYHIVRQAEHAKIRLSETTDTEANLDCVEQGLYAAVSQSLFAAAIQPSLTTITHLMQQAIEQASQSLSTPCQPDVIYVTGGTARSPVIYQQITNLFPTTPVMLGDHFGSVTVGLTRWAKKAFATPL